MFTPACGSCKERTSVRQQARKIHYYALRFIDLSGKPLVHIGVRGVGVRTRLVSMRFNHGGLLQFLLVQIKEKDGGPPFAAPEVVQQLLRGLGHVKGSSNPA